MADNQLERFFGGSPFWVAVRLILLSIVIGVLLHVLGFDPWNIWWSLERLVRRIHVIKSLMDEGMTLEDIRHSFIFFRGQLDGVERALDDLFAALDKAIAEKGDIKASRRRELERMLNDGRHKAHSFIKDMERTVSQITAREETGKGDR